MENTENELKICFDRPFVFEGAEYKEIDLSGLHSMTTEDLCRVGEIYTTMAPTRSSLMSVPEMDIEYVCIIAAEITGQPIEFFKKLPAKEGRKIKNRVMKYFFSDSE